jgi:uncharacterized protein (DUF1330 family)
MAALVIVDIGIKDPVRYAEYKRLAAPTVTAHGGRYLVRGGKVDLLEGSWSPRRLVVLEFPSAEGARQWWDSEEYRAPKALRQQCASTEMIVVEGV